MDVQIRCAVRHWLRLPKDVPDSYIYANVADGGLGVPCFRVFVARLRYSRFQSLCASEDPVVKAVTELDYFRRRLSKAADWVKFGTAVISSKGEERVYWAQQLYSKIDGHGLRESSDVPEAHRWISDGTTLLSGHEFVDLVRLRINAMPTKARTTRGRPDSDKVCRAGCRLPSGEPARETLPHILQCCFRTHGARIKRHDAVSKMVGDKLERSGWAVLHEPHFNTAAGLRKPDLVVTRNNASYVIDSQVILDSSPSASKHRDKVNYYRDNRDIRTRVVAETGCTSVQFSSVTLNWRGVWNKQSAKDLMALGLSKTDLKFISIRVLQGDLQQWRFFGRVTSVARLERAGVG